jgi:hypothetical protein
MRPAGQRRDCDTRSTRREPGSRAPSKPPILCLGTSCVPFPASTWATP